MDSPMNLALKGLEDFRSNFHVLERRTVALGFSQSNTTGNRLKLILEKTLGQDIPCLAIAL